MDRDARAILNMRKRQQKNKYWNATKPVTDARQILRIKRILQKKSTPQFKPRQTYAMNQAPKKIFKKQFNQVVRQQVRNSNRISFSDKVKNLNKKVQIERNGILRITSNGVNNNLPKSSLLRDKKIYSDGADITVTTQNKEFQKKTALESRANDDLEKMTLDDLPEVGASVKRSLTSSSLRAQRAPSPPPTLASRYQLMTNTMVADTRAQHAPSPPPTLASRYQLMTNTMVADTVRSSAASQDYKILVTNLGNRVTEDDIIELFSDVGTLKSATLLQPGTALVEYYTKEEALMACDTYHNRLLDGLPMQCVLQSGSSVNRTSVASRLGGKFLSSSPPLYSDLPTPSFTPASSFSNPYYAAAASKNSGRSVEFTVKLP